MTTNQLLGVSEQIKITFTKKVKAD